MGNFGTNFFFFRLFNGIPKVMVPMMWFRQTIELTEELANQAKVIEFTNYNNGFFKFNFFFSVGSSCSKDRTLHLLRIYFDWFSSNSDWCVLNCNQILEKGRRR